MRAPARYRWTRPTSWCAPSSMGCGPLAPRAAGLNVRCRNGIPHSRGLGSSAAAVVGGLAAVNGLVAQAGFETDVRSGVDPAGIGVRGPSRQRRRPRCSAVQWCRGLDRRGRRRAMAPRRCSCIPTSACSPRSPQQRSLTAETRVLLPGPVSHVDARFNVSRAALLVVALTERPDLLMEATEDVLHQPHRATAMRASAEYLRLLRRCGVAAVLSGAGPAVIASEHSAGTARRGPRIRRRQWIHRQRDVRRRAAFDGRQAWPYGVDSCHTRISGFLASGTDAGYSRSRPAIAWSSPAPTPGHTNSSRG